MHRFADDEYADLSLLMRTGERSGEVFDVLVSRGEVVVHASDVERLAALADVEGLVIADTHEQVGELNATIRDARRCADTTEAVTTGRGEQVGVGDPISTRRNVRDLDVANRDTWTVHEVDHDGSLRVSGERGERTLPASYVRAYVELAYATTAYGAQGQTVDTAHLLVGESTGAATAYVGMTRGRHRNVAHLVAESLGEAREQWIQTFTRDGADLGPGHAATAAEEAIERYGPTVPRPSAVLQAAALREAPRRPRPEPPTSRPPSPGISI